MFRSFLPRASKEQDLVNFSFVSALRPLTDPSLTVSNPNGIKFATSDKGLNDAMVSHSWSPLDHDPDPRVPLQDGSNCPYDHDMNNNHPLPAPPAPPPGLSAPRESCSSSTSSGGGGASSSGGDIFQKINALLDNKLDLGNILGCEGSGAAGGGGHGAARPGSTSSSLSPNSSVFYPSRMGFTASRENAGGALSHGNVFGLSSLGSAGSNNVKTFNVRK